MFRFCINQKIFNFFKRKEYNFIDRLTSYRLIRILYRQNTGNLQAFYRLFIGNAQAVNRRFTGKIQTSLQ